MGIKKFFTSIIKSLIIFLIVTLIFSAVTLNFPNLLKNVFGDIFEYASPEAQKQAVSKLAETCSSLDQGNNVVTANQLCTNKTLLEDMRESCRNYRELKSRNAKIENEEQVKETCKQIESGELESSCSEIGGKGSLALNFSKLGALCKDYNAGKIDDKEFFFDVMASALPDQIQTPQIGVLDKYNKALNYLNNNKLFYFLILAVLLILLYLLIMNVNLFIITLAQISFSIGILVMLPYFIVLAYEKFIGIDTTPILGNMFGFGNGFDLKAIISVILLLFLRTYTSFIVILGIIFLAIGIYGKIYGFMLKRKPKSKTEEANVIEEAAVAAKKTKAKKNKSKTS